MFVNIITFKPESNHMEEFLPSSKVSNEKSKAQTGLNSFPGSRSHSSYSAGPGSESYSLTPGFNVTTPPTPSRHLTLSFHPVSHLPLVPTTGNTLNITGQFTVKGFKYLSYVQVVTMQ